MLELIAFWGFLGGLLRALAGFLSHGKPAWKSIPLALAVTGFVGIISAFAVFYLEGSLYAAVFWKAAFAAGLMGYVGVDILNSLFDILENRRIEI